jgi:anthranilate synthase component I
MTDAYAAVLPDGVVHPSREGFHDELRQHRVVPVVRRLLADAETPISAYRKLAADRPGTFLLESAEPGRSFSRWSFVGVGAVAALSVTDGAAAWSGTVPAGIPTSGDPLRVLAEAWRTLSGPRRPDLPPLTGGFVGYLGYDVVRRIERLPDKAVDDLGLPELTMLLVTDLAAVDHHQCSVVLIANALVHPDMSRAEIAAAHADAVARLDSMQAALATPAPPTIASTRAVAPKEAVSRTAPGEYQRSVSQAIEAIRAGEVFQIVPGQRFSVATTADPLDVYRVLRTLNPSPYMYYLHLDQLDIVGSSPEALVTVHGTEATIHPIAGTRRRGETPERDAELITEMVNDPKERCSSTWPATTSAGSVRPDR